MVRGVVESGEGIQESWWNIPFQLSDHHCIFRMIFLYPWGGLYSLLFTVLWLDNSIIPFIDSLNYSIFLNKIFYNRCIRISDHFSQLSHMLRDSFLPSSSFRIFYTNSAWRVLWPISKWPKLWLLCCCFGVECWRNYTFCLKTVRCCCCCCCF